MDEQRLIVNRVRSGDDRFYTLVAIVAMPDHAHIVLFADKGYDLGRIMKGLKGSTARFINRQRGIKGSLWQNESFDRIIRSEREFYRKLLYILHNPVKAGLTNDPMNYPGWYCNEKFFAAG